MTQLLFKLGHVGAVAAPAVGCRDPVSIDLRDPPSIHPYRVN